MPNRNYTLRLFSYLSSCPSDYLIIGGAAAEFLLSQRDVPFRETKDFDIITLLGALRNDEVHPIAYPDKFKKEVVEFLSVLQNENSIQTGLSLGYRKQAYSEIIRRYAVIFGL